MDCAVPELESLYAVWRNSLAIAAVRGFTVPPLLADCSYSDFCHMSDRWTSIRGLPSMRIFDKIDGSGERLLMVWPDAPRVKEAHAAGFVTLCQTLHATQAVMIVQGRMRESAARLLDDYCRAEKGRITIDCFYESELRTRTNPCHYLVFPETRILTDRRAIERVLLGRRVRSPRDLPSIAQSELVSRFLGVRPGDVVCLVCGTRDACHTSYRHVI